MFPLTNIIASTGQILCPVLPRWILWPCYNWSVLECLMSTYTNLGDDLESTATSATERWVRGSRMFVTVLWIHLTSGSQSIPSNRLPTSFCCGKNYHCICGMIVRVINWLADFPEFCGGQFSLDTFHNLLWAGLSFFKMNVLAIFYTWALYIADK